MRKIAGKRALVTGAASGIGRAIALRLATGKVDLFLLDIDELGLNRVGNEAKRLGVDTLTQWCDVSSEADICNAVATAVDRWAGVDILVNNAGITYHGMTHLMPAAEWDRLLAINLHGPLNLTRQLLPSLLARPEAHVLNVCSVLGLVGMPRVNAYCTAKYGLVGFSESLRAEYARSGLGVTALCPGFAETNLFSAATPAVPGTQPKRPPKSICTTPEKVAKKAVRAIIRNQALVRMEPFSRVLFRAKQFCPGVIDRLLRLGVNKRVRRQREELARLSSDETEAIRMYLAKQQATQAKRLRAA